MIQKINYADKQTGGKFSASDANEIKSTVNLNADVLSENSQSILSLQGGSLGPIKPTDAAPTPARNGNYTFSIGGNKPSWLTSEVGITTVKAGDGVAVVYAAPSSYTYTHVDVRSDLVTNQELEELLKNEIYVLGNNLFNKDTVTNDYYINGGNGNTVAGAGWLCSDFIKIKPNTIYSAMYTIWESAFYDINKQYISGQSNIISQITSPANAYYIRFSHYNVSPIGIMFNEGSTALPFEAYVRSLRYQKPVEGFKTRTTYDTLTELILASSKSTTTATDISGWGGLFNKTGISFNAIRMPAGATIGTVPDLRKMKYIQIMVRNAKTDSTFIAKSPLIDVDGLTTLPEILFPLMNTELTEYVTLNDSSFSGGTYWVNIYYYNALMAFAYGGAIHGGMDNYVSGSSCYMTSDDVTSWRGWSGTPAPDFEHIYLTNPRTATHLIELDEIQEQIDTLSTDLIEISLPDKIYAVVGDTLQLFIRGMVKAVNPYNYDVVVNCAKGKIYPRYFEYIPTSGDVGTTNFNVKVKNNSGKVLATKTCSLVTKAAAQAPATLNKVLFIGDSLTNARIYPSEAFRRLTQSGGTPAGLGLSNIAFVGRKNASYGIGVEGNSGWSWGDYLTAGRRAFTFAITAPTTMPTVEAVYKDANNKTYTMWWNYSTTSIKMLVDDMVSTPPASGVLTKISGTGDATITYSAAVQSSGNPFWNDSIGALDFTAYVNKWCGGSLNVIYTLLTWNCQYGNRTDFSTFTNYARTLFNHIKTEYPNIKIKIMGVQLADLKQGMRVDGSPSENTYTDQYGLVVTALNMNKAFQDLANEVALSGFVEFVNVSSQVDSEYNMPYTDKAVNTRNSINESVGTNDVHPNENGYNQIADVVFRNYVSNFCQ